MSPFRLDSTNSVNAFLDRIGGTPVKLTPPRSVEELVASREINEADRDTELSRPELDDEEGEVKSDSSRSSLSFDNTYRIFSRPWMALMSC